MRRLWLAAFAWTAAHGHGDFSFDALPLIFCTLTYPAGDKIHLPLAIKILCFYVLTYPLGSPNTLQTLWLSCCEGRGFILISCLNKLRKKGVIWPRFVFELQALELYLTSIS